MGQLSRPSADHLGLLRELLGFIRDPRQIEQHVSQLEAATEQHDSAAAEAGRLQEKTKAEREAADVSAAHADERHAEADKREAELRVSADRLVAGHNELRDAKEAHEAEVAAYERRRSDTEAMHATLSDEIVAKHAETIEALTAAQEARGVAEAAKAEALRFREEAATALARAKAILSAAEG